MNVLKRVSDDNSTIIITVVDFFDARTYVDFKAAFEEIQQSALIEVDLSSVKVMDSSGLGLLIQLRDHASSIQSELAVVRPSPVARRNLETAYFNEILTIRD